MESGSPDPQSADLWSGDRVRDPIAAGEDARAP
jgi:hypothetical protein